MLGELVQTTDGKWIAPPPAVPTGHPLGPNQVLVGHIACLGHGGGGHTSWRCRTCEAVVYGPPMAKHRTALEGPAAVRISTCGRRPGHPMDHREVDTLVRVRC
jgi:hypothetical protein